jgi:hypothetical protein
MRRGVFFACVAVASLASVGAVASCELVDGLGSFAFDASPSDATHGEDARSDAPADASVDSDSESSDGCNVDEFASSPLSGVKGEKDTGPFCVEANEVTFCQFTELKKLTGGLDEDGSTSCPMGLSVGTTPEGGALINSSCAAKDYCRAIQRVPCTESEWRLACQQETDSGGYVHPEIVVDSEGKCAIVGPGCTTEAGACRPGEMRAFRCCEEDASACRIHPSGGQPRPP